MALSNITIGGTGEVLIKYVLSGTEYMLTSGPGSFSIDNAGTSYKWAVLSGSPTLTATGFTSPAFVQITSNYKKFSWDLYTSIYGNSGAQFASDSGDFNFTSLIVGSTTYTFTSPATIFDVSKVADEINYLKNPSIQSKSFKIDSATPTSTAVIVYGQTLNLVIDVKDLTGDVYLKIVNLATNTEYLLKGVADTSTNGIPSGYLEVFNTCENKSSFL